MEKKSRKNYRLSRTACEIIDARDTEKYKTEVDFIEAAVRNMAEYQEVDIVKKLDEIKEEIIREVRTQKSIDTELSGMDFKGIYE